MLDYIPYIVFTSLMNLTMSSSYIVANYSLSITSPVLVSIFKTRVEMKALFYS